MTSVADHNGTNPMRTSLTLISPPSLALYPVPRGTRSSCVEGAENETRRMEEPTMSSGLRAGGMEPFRSDETKDFLLDSSSLSLHVKTVNT